MAKQPGGPTDSGGTTEKSLQCVIVTPETTLVDEAADFVVLPLYDGELGVQPMHSPLIGRLGYGEVRVKRGEATRRFYVEGGFAQVTMTSVVILATKAIKSEDLDETKLQAELAKLPAAPAGDAVARAARAKQEEQLKAQIRVAQRAVKQRMQLN